MSRLTPYEMVKEFREAFGKENEYTLEKVEHQLTLIEEEADELWHEVNQIDSSGFLFQKDIDKERLTKELCDLIYVCYDFAIALELPVNEAFRRVHQSNLSKLGEDGKPVYREDGKVLKGPNYQKPDLSDLFQGDLFSDDP